jgi:hypothetical protein
VTDADWLARAAALAATVLALNDLPVLLMKSTNTGQFRILTSPRRKLTRG